MSNKLHELLAVEKDVKSSANMAIEKTAKTFSDGIGLFDGFIKTYDPINSEDTEVLDSESKQITATVPDVLEHFSGAMVKMFDLIYRKEVTNSGAVADIIISGDKDFTIAERVPVTVLVQYEKILDSLRNRVYAAIPTLIPSKKWELDSHEKNVYKTPEHKKLRTKKVVKAFELSPATQHHPAQVQAINEDVPAGFWVITEWSGVITAAEKTDILNRLDAVISAVKKARARANNIEVVKVAIGKKLFKYIQNGK